MNSLADEQIVLSRKGDSPLNESESADLLLQLQDWELINENDCDRLTKSFSLSDYESAVALTRKIAAIAEQINHHPVIVLEWGKVTVTWWTHVIGGLHRNDFIMAAKSDRAAMLVSTP